MRPPVRLALLAVAALAAIALAAVVTLGEHSGARDGASRSPHQPGTSFDGAVLPAKMETRGFTLTDEDHQRVSLVEYRGRPLILAFLYATSSRTAPLIAQQIRGALDELSPDVAALAVSVDPAADTPARVRALLGRTGLTGRMHYLTGTREQLRAVWRAYAVTPASAGARAYARAASVLLLDKRGVARVSFPVEQLTPEGLAHDVRRLQAE